MDLLKLTQTNYLRYKTTYYIVMLILNVFNVFDFEILYNIFIASYIALIFFDIYMFFFRKDKEEVRTLKKNKYDMVEYMISYSILFVSLVIVTAIFIGTMMNLNPTNFFSTLNISYAMVFIGIHLYVFVFEIINRDIKLKSNIKLDTSKMRMRLFQILMMMYEIVYIYVYIYTYHFRAEIKPSILSLFIIFPPILILIIQGLYLQKRNEYLILKNEEVK